MKILLLILETTGVSFVIAKLAEHIPSTYWSAIPNFYRFTILAAIVAMVCVGANELRRGTTTPDE